MADDSENRCAKCQKSNPEGMRFCGFCGSPLAAAYQTPSAPAPATGTLEVPTFEETTAVSEAPSHDSSVPFDPDRTIDIRSAIPTPPAPPATPPPTPTLRPKPSITIPTDPVAREVERDRLMTQAGVFRAKGQITDARETLEKALAMAQGGKPRDIAMVHEQIGDLLLVEEELEAATEAFQQAFHIDPTRTTAEKKIASTQMAISDREAEKRLGQKALQDDSIASIIASGDLTGHGGKRNAGIAMGLSVAVPGFGQIYNGQLVKGLILIAVFAIALLVISFSPEKDDLFKLIGSTFALKPARDVSVSPPIMAVAVIGFIAWIYAIVDAPFFTRQNEVSREERSPSAVDKSGWEV